MGTRADRTGTKGPAPFFRHHCCRGVVHSWCSFALLAGCLLHPVETLAASIISASANQWGSFTIRANNLNRMIEAEISINYESDDLTPPQVTGLDSAATLTSAVKAPGSIVIQVRRNKPLSGFASLAVASIPGNITYLSALLRYENGTTEVSQTSFTNLPKELLDPEETKLTRSARNSRNRTVVNPEKVSAVEASDAIPPARIETPTQRTPEERPLPHSFSRHKSLFERFSAVSGERTTATLVNLLSLSETDIVQTPPLLLADGSASLRLMIRPPAHAPEVSHFYISGCHCTNLMAGDNGAWILEITPERGAVSASVSILAGREVIEYPLAVAPPLDLFDAASADPVLADFVRVVNDLVNSARAKKNSDERRPVP